MKLAQAYYSLPLEGDRTAVVFCSFQRRNCSKLHKLGHQADWRLEFELYEWCEWCDELNK